MSYIIYKKLLNTELQYDLNEGVLYRKVKVGKGGIKPGEPDKWAPFNLKPQYKNKSTQYNRTKIDGKAFTLHRIIAHMVFDDFDIFNPKQQIDHRDHNGLNNDPYNLKVVSNRQNCQHRKTKNGKDIQGYTKYKETGNYLFYYNDEKGIRHRKCFDKTQFNEGVKWREENIKHYYNG